MSFVAILSIALGVGANTAIFTLLDQVLLRLLPVPEPERIVRVQTDGFYYGSTNGTGRELSYPMFTALRDHQQVFDGHAGLLPDRRRHPRRAWRGERRDDTGGAGLGRLLLDAAGAGRARPAARRHTTTAPGATPVAVITHRYWQRRFAGDPVSSGARCSSARSR